MCFTRNHLIYRKRLREQKKVTRLNTKVIGNHKEANHQEERVNITHQFTHQSMKKAFITNNHGSRAKIIQKVRIENSLLNILLIFMIVPLKISTTLSIIVNRPRVRKTPSEMWVFLCKMRSSKHSKRVDKTSKSVVKATSSFLRLFQPRKNNLQFLIQI